jgi:hypothetical protein
MTTKVSGESELPITASGLSGSTVPGVPLNAQELRNPQLLALI